METIQTRIVDATARLSLVTSSRRYPDRQIRESVYTYINKTRRRRPWLPSPLRWVDTLQAATFPRATLTPRLVPPLSFAPTAAVSVQPLPSFLSHTHLHPPSYRSLIPCTSYPYVVLRYHFLLLLLRPSLPSRRCHRRLFYPRWPRP